MLLYNITNVMMYSKGYRGVFVYFETPAMVSLAAIEIVIYT